MDLRVKKTKESIRKAFIELREKKPVEKISVKELSEAAQINKATFYLHYKDIYDLSESIENSLVEVLFHEIENKHSFIEEPKAFTIDLFNAYLNNRELMDKVFSGSRRYALVDSIEQKIRGIFFTAHPELKDNVRLNTRLTYEIKGGYYAFFENLPYGEDAVVEVISSASDLLSKMPI